MVWGFAVAARNAGLSAMLGLLDAGPGAGKIEIRSGARPAAPADAATGTLLATIVLGKPAFGAAAAGSSTVADPPSVNAVAAGTASWCRAMDSTGAVVMDGKVTDSAGDGDVKLLTTALVVGQPVDITGGSMLMPQGG